MFPTTEVYFVARNSRLVALAPAVRGHHRHRRVRGRVLYEASQSQLAGCPQTPGNLSVARAQPPRLTKRRMGPRYPSADPRPRSGRIPERSRTERTRTSASRHPTQLRPPRPRRGVGTRPLTRPKRLSRCAEIGTPSGLRTSTFAAVVGGFAAVVSLLLALEGLAFVVISISTWPQLWA